MRDNILRVAIKFAARMSFLTLVAGYGFWLLALWYLSLPLPSRILNLVHWLIIGHALVWWIAPLSVPKRAVHLLTRQGVGDRRWSSWVGYSIEMHPLSAEHFVVKLWTKDRLRDKELSLPEDERLQRLIVRYVDRYLPALETLNDAEMIRADPPDLPWWFVPVSVCCAAIHGVIVGFLVNFCKSKFGWSGDGLMLSLLLASILHPAWILAWLAGRKSQYRRIKPRFGAIAIVVTFISFVTAMVTMVVLSF